MTKLNTVILTAALATLAQVAAAAQPVQPAQSAQSTRSAPPAQSATPAPATAARSPKQLIVRFADLDLSQPSGAAALYERMTTGAKLVCSPYESRELARQAAFRKCIAEAMARAVTQIDRPGLTAYYRGKVEGSNAAPIEVASNKVAGPLR